MAVVENIQKNRLQLAFMLPPTVTPILNLMKGELRLYGQNGTAILELLDNSKAILASAQWPMKQWEGYNFKIAVDWPSPVKVIMHSPQMMVNDVYMRIEFEPLNYLQEEISIISLENQRATLTALQERPIIVKKEIPEKVLQNILPIPIRGKRDANEALTVSLSSSQLVFTRGSEVVYSTEVNIPDLKVTAVSYYLDKYVSKVLEYIKELAKLKDTFKYEFKYHIEIRSDIEDITANKVGLLIFAITILEGGKEVSRIYVYIAPRLR